MGGTMCTGLNVEERVCNAGPSDSDPVLTVQCSPPKGSGTQLSPRVCPVDVTFSTRRPNVGCRIVVALDSSWTSLLFVSLEHPRAAPRGRFRISCHTHITRRSSSDYLALKCEIASMSAQERTCTGPNKDEWVCEVGTKDSLLLFIVRCGLPRGRGSNSVRIHSCGSTHEFTNASTH